jgi:hypothetical protein
MVSNQSGFQLHHKKAHITLTWEHSYCESRTEKNMDADGVIGRILQVSRSGSFHFDTRSPRGAGFGVLSCLEFFSLQIWHVCSTPTCEPALYASSDLLFYA